MSMSAIIRSSALRQPALMSARAFSTVDHAPPLKLFGIAGRYANATYTAASKKGELDKVETELLGFQELMNKKPEFKLFLSNPTVTRQQKVDTIEAIFNGKKSSKVVLNLMTTLAGNARLDETSNVTNAFVELMKAKRGEVDAVITSSIPLSAAQLKKASELLKNQSGGKSISISTKVDESLLGGMTLQIGDKFLDLSVKSQLDHYRASLLSA